LALRREDVDLFVEEVGAEALHELARIRLVGRAHVHQLLDPCRPLVVALLTAALVEPVRSDAVLGGDVHLARSYLDFQWATLRPDHGRVQGAVAVELRHCDVVLEAAGHRLPERMDQT
jgi:hypothetical protein